MELKQKLPPPQSDLKDQPEEQPPTIEVSVKEISNWSMGLWIAGFVLFMIIGFLIIRFLLQ